MKKRTTILTAITITGLLLVGCTAAAAQAKHLGMETAKNTAVKDSEFTPKEFSIEKDNSKNELSEAEAKKIALDQVPGAKESDIREFEVDYDDGRLEYEGSIWFEELEYEFEIDGYSGAIRSWEVESIYD